jgi:SH3-like domain-containing protein
VRQAQRIGSNFRARFRRSAALALAVALLSAASLPSRAADKTLPVPRFVTLRSDEVNLRTGPGEQYPIDWVLTRKNMPVEIILEFKNWRKIRDADGTEGWVNERMVTGKRAVLVRGQVRQLHESPSADSGVVARAEPGVVASLLTCQKAWCRVEANGFRGWLKRDEIWGVYPDEVIE